MERTYYTLPKVRFTNFCRFVVFLDGIVSIALWVAGGHTAYLESSITKWTITGSTFELACISLLRMLFFFHAFTKLEDYALSLLENPYDPKLTRRKTLTHILTIILSLATLAYCCTKGGLVLYAYLNDDTYQLMHPTYNALVISSVAFSILEFLLTILAPPFLKKLQRIRVEHKLIVDDENDGEKKPNVNLIRLMGLAKKEFWLLFLGFVTLVVSSATTMAVPLFFGYVVDAAVHGTMEEVNRYVLLLCLVSVAGAFAAMFRSWSFTLAGIRVVCNIRKTLFAAIIRQEIAFFDTNRTGELTNRLSSDTQVVQNAVTVNVSMLFRYLFQIFGSVIIMLSQSAALTGVLLSVVPVVAVGAVIYGKFAQSIRQQFQDALGDAGTAAEESISSVRTVRSFVGERKAMGAYDKEIQKSYRHGKNLAIATGFFNGLIGTISQGAITLVLWYGGKLVYMNRTGHGGITVGTLTAFMLYTLNVAMAFAFLASLYGDFMQALGASVRIFQLMDRVPKVSISGGSQPLDFTGDIKFDDVCFTYPSRPDSQVLKGVTLEVKPGQMVALVGPSGGGKSTIVNLIEKFYEPEDGTIYLGGHNVLQLDPEWFRKKISIVSQEPVLFACSIRDNIAYGKDATDEEVIAAAKMANAHDFIMSFEEGYSCLVGERGTRLSGGQKQRVAIARALIMDPSILLLDEATSALDAESEHLVQEAVDRAMIGRTVLVIAHRLSTVRNASKVIVIKNGKIAESGTHEELILKGGVYKKLVLRQLSAADNQHKMQVDGLAINADNDDVEDINEIDEEEEDDDDEEKALLVDFKN